MFVYVMFALLMPLEKHVTTRQCEIANDGGRCLVLHVICNRLLSL
jgi:hypothetical protein